MNKKKIIIIIVITILLSNFLTLTISKNYNKITDIQLTNQSWENYDNSLKTIKNNMDSITEPNEDFYWWTLKDFDIEDDDYENILNSLVASVRMCYLEYTDAQTLYTNSNPLRKYRDKQYITKKELEKLNNDIFYEIKTGCLKRFEQYNSLLISNDQQLRNKVLHKTNQILTIKSTELFKNKNATYNELLLRKTIEVHYLEDISEFLVEEYNRLK